MIRTKLSRQNGADHNIRIIIFLVMFITTFCNSPHLKLVFKRKSMQHFMHKMFADLFMTGNCCFFFLFNLTKNNFHHVMLQYFCF